MEEQYVAVGRVSGLYGVRGWVKIFSYTRPRENIVNYQPWILERGSKTDRRDVDAGRVHGKGVIAHLSGVDDRDSAAALVGADILVDRAQFAQTAENEFYWADLVGLEVVTTSGEILGIVVCPWQARGQDLDGFTRFIEFHKDCCMQRVSLLITRNCFPIFFQVLFCLVKLTLLVVNNAR